MDEASRHRTLEASSDDELFALVQDRAERAGRRAREALEVLFDRHHARVHGQCVRLLGDEHLADDATQEIFLSLLEKTVRYDDRQYFGSWLYIVVRNHCLNLRRRRRREVQSEEFDGLWDLLVDPGNPGRELQNEELARIVDATCEEHLTAKERQVLHLRYFWGLRVKEINQAMGLKNVSGARSHLATAHRKLRQALAPHVAEEGLRTLLDEG